MGDKDFYVRQIIRYVTLVNGKRPDGRSIIYWSTMDERDLKKTYKKWQYEYMKEVKNGYVDSVHL